MMKKSKVWPALACLILFFAAIPFWIFPKIEEKLNNQAESLESFNALKNTELKWNGRNGYLYVPVNADKSLIESVAGDIEDIQGVRKIQIIYDENIIVYDDLSENAIEKVPGRFIMIWTSDDKNISGKLDKESTKKVEGIFKIAGLDVDDRFLLSDTALNKLSLIGEDIFEVLSEGALEVDGEKIKLSGVFAEDADIEDLISQWEKIEGLELNLEIPEKTEVTEVIINETEKAQEEINNLLSSQGIYFDSERATVRRDSIDIIDGIAQILIKYKDVKVDIIGHKDSMGGEEYNLILSEKRAKGVMQLLIERGIDESRMTSFGSGETVPIDTNETEEGQANNRRVEIIVRGND